MPYKISGTKSETARVMILKESDWSMESNTVISGSGAYEVSELTVGDKTVVVESNEDEILAYGNIAAIEYASAGTGGLWAWGHNEYGALGQGDTIDRSSPVQVGALEDWKNIGLGRGTYVVNDSGEFWVTGLNSLGQLGLGDIVNRSSPVQVGGLSDWDIVSSHGFVSFGIKTDGTLWTWGYNTQGQLGLGYISPDRHSSPVQVGALTDWGQASVGFDSNIQMSAVKTDNTLWSWGYNAEGQLGLGDQDSRSSPVQVGGLSNWAQVDCGDSTTSMAVKTDGTLWGWGTNYDYQIAQSNTLIKYSSPVQVGALTDWSMVSCGWRFAVGLKTDGTLWSWGKNTEGQLGVGDVTIRSSPVQIGSLTNWSGVSVGRFHTTAINTDNTIWTWGYNHKGQLGLGDQDSRSSPTQIGLDTNWLKVESEVYHSAAIK